jgi:hypothetical protein
MKLQSWALAAEIVSGIAIVLTLVFLAMEIRENSAITRAAAYDRNIDSLNTWRLSMASDPELARIWSDITHSDATAQELQGGFVPSALWGIYENAYHSKQYGILGPSEWGRFEVQICRLFEQTANQWAEAQASAFESRQFKRGRQAAASIGLTPRHYGTGGRTGCSASLVKGTVTCAAF